MTSDAANLASSSRPLEISSRRPLFFVHVPKAAGTSINQFLLRRFPDGAIRCLQHQADSFAVNRRDLGQHACYLGHEVFHFAEALPSPPVVMTILREPVDRALSAYDFCQSLGRDQVRALTTGWSGQLARICDMPLDEFLRAEPLAARQNLGNYQTAMFSHSLMPHLSGQMTTPADLVVAKENLRRCAVIGLAERFSDSLRLICHTFGWPCPERMGWENKTPVRQKVADLAPDTLRKLREMTALDAELYHYGVELFEQQLAAIERGLVTQSDSAAVVSAAAIPFDGVIPGYGWSSATPSPHGTYRWSEEDAWVELPMAGQGTLTVRVRVLCCLQPHQIQELELFVNRHPMKLRRHNEQIGWTLESQVELPPQEREAGRLRLRFRSPRLLRPCDVIPGSTDARALGVGVQRVELCFASALARAA